MSVLSEEEKRDIEAKWAWSKKPTNEFIDLINATEQATINKVVKMIDRYPCRNDKEYKWLLDSIQNELIGKQD